VIAMRVRASVWRGDRAELRRLHDETSAMAERMTRLQPATYVRVILGEISPEEYAQIIESTPQPASARLRTLRAQMSSEIWAIVGDLERAKRTLLEAADDALIDIEWLERSPLLEPLRGSPELAEARRRTRLRAAVLLGAT